MKCPSCEQGELKIINDIINELESYVFIVKGRRCSFCGEEFIDQQEGQQMISTARRLGVWGEPLKLHRKLSRSARGTVLRIPTDIEKNLDLKGTEEVSISKIGGRRLLIEIE